MRDKIVFDIETKNTFADVGGQEHIKKLDASVIGLYSYNEDAYYCFDESEFDKAGKYFQNAYMIIGFYSKSLMCQYLRNIFHLILQQSNTLIF